MTARTFTTFVGRAGMRTTFALALAAFLLTGFSFAEPGSAAPLAWTDGLLTVSDRIGIKTETPDANTVLDATRSDVTDTMIKVRHATKGAYFQTQSGVLWAGYNMLNAAGATSTYFGYRGSTQFRVFDALASQDRILMDAAGTSNGNIYFNPTNTGGVGIGTMTLSARLDVETASGAAIDARSTATTGTLSAIYGQSDSFNGRGVAGHATTTSGNGIGVYGTSASYAGVWGENASTTGIGVYGNATASSGYTTGVFGQSHSALGAGVFGYSQDSGIGVYGYNDLSGAGVYGENPSASGWAGYFNGDVGVDGTLYKSAGGFQIGHPLDPTKVLNHSFVESPDMKNIYDGVVTLDENGEAAVELPDWFEALNQDFRYQLTPIGQFAELYIAQKIEGNRFVIAGGAPGMEVSWQVTGIRHDAYAETHRIPVEEERPVRTAGTRSGGIDADLYVPEPAEQQ